MNGISARTCTAGVTGKRHAEEKKEKKTLDLGKQVEQPTDGLEAKYQTDRQKIKSPQVYHVSKKQTRKGNVMERLHIQWFALLLFALSLLQLDARKVVDFSETHSSKVGRTRNFVLQS